MPYLYTDEAGRRFPKKTLTVDVYASRLDEGVLTPTTKSLGFKTYLADTPTSPFFIDEQAYLKAFRAHWESVILELAPKFGLTANEAKRIFTTSISRTSPSSTGTKICESTREAVLSIDPAVIAHGKPVAELKRDFAANVASVLRRSAASKRFVSIAPDRLRSSIIKLSDTALSGPASVTSAVSFGITALVQSSASDAILSFTAPLQQTTATALVVRSASVKQSTELEPQAAEEITTEVTTEVTMNNRHQQIKDLPAGSQDHVADIVPARGIDRPERKKLVLSKLREDAFPLHHEWDFWHERLDRRSSSITKSINGSETIPYPYLEPAIYVGPHGCLLLSPVTSSESISQTLKPVTKNLSSTVTSQDQNIKCQASNDFATTPRYGLANTTTTPVVFAEPTKSSPVPAYEETLVHLMTANTVKKFWEVINNFEIGTLRLRDSIHLFKKTVKPVWEDPRNVRGGSWTFRINKSISRGAWQGVQMMAIGEVLQEVVLPGDDICGVSLSVRFNSHLISIWNRDASNQASINAIRAKVLEQLPEEFRPSAANIYYKKHSEHNGFNEAVAAKKSKVENAPL